MEIISRIHELYETPIGELSTKLTKLVVDLGIDDS